MTNDAPLGPRFQEILKSVVRAFIETGEPVGSRFVAKLRKDALSAASVRNVMADLDEAGYLEQPHTSAGRSPTEKAFRFYVSSLTASPVPGHDAERLRQEFCDLHTVEARVERSSHVLMELTRNVGIAAAIPELAQELDQIELIPLADRRVLMILATRDRMVRHRVVALDEAVTPDLLVSLRNYVNRNFAGWRLGAARRELLRRILEEHELFDEAMRQLESLCRKGLLDPDTSPEVHLEGASNLFGQDLRLTREKMRELLRALEEKSRLMDLLDRFLERPAGELEVHVGLQTAHPAMRDLALIGMTVRMAGGLPAKVAVLGPVRMRYERVMSAVLQTSRALESARF